jgi:hypothetical protein
MTVKKSIWYRCAVPWQWWCRVLPFWLVKKCSHTTVYMIGSADFLDAMQCAGLFTLIQNLLYVILCNMICWTDYRNTYKSLMTMVYPIMIEQADILHCMIGKSNYLTAKLWTWCMLWFFTLAPNLLKIMMITIIIVIINILVILLIINCTCTLLIKEHA